MEIDITRLNSGIDKYIIIEEKVSFESDRAKGIDLLDLKNTIVKGKLFKNSMQDIELEIEIEGIMILPCAISLKPTDYEFKIELNKNIDVLASEIDEIIKKTKNSIDILPIIWENILVEIPTRVINDDLSDVVSEGDGWKIITEQEKTYINPELEKLRNLLK